MELKHIILNALKGDQKAQKALFYQTSKNLKVVALRYVKYSDAADDVLQETYIRIFRKLDSFEYISDAATMGWMRQIASREALRYINQNSSWKNRSVDHNFTESVDKNPLLHDDMYKMLLTLPKSQRIIFNMAAIEGYSHKEIAAHLGIAESSSRSLLTRARKHLQKEHAKSFAYEKV